MASNPTPTNPSENSSQNSSGQSQGPKKFWQHGYYCQRCGRYHYGFGYGILRALMAIVIVLVVFWLGVMVGSRNGFHRRTFYGSGFGGYPYPMRGYYPSGRMLPGGTAPMWRTATSTPAATSTQ